MKRVLKWVAIVLGSLIVLMLGAGIVLYYNGSERLSRVYDVQPEAVEVPADPDSIERGRRLADIYCAGCHGDDLAGIAFLEDPGLGTIPSQNLTPGEGGVGGAYTTADWVRAVRHGITPAGRALIIMPSKNLYFLSDADLGDILAYMETLPPVDRAWSAPDIKPLGRILIAAGAMGDSISAELIDHDSARPDEPQPGVTVDYGEYLATTFGCRDCHGDGLTGGKSADPAAPPAPDLTSGGPAAAWTAENFILFVRTLESPTMPWKDLNAMTDDELEAIWLYLRSLDPAGAAQR